MSRNELALAPTDRPRPSAFELVKNPLHSSYHDCRSGPHLAGWLAENEKRRKRRTAVEAEYCEQRGSLNGQREQRFIRDALLLDLRANENC